MAETEPEGPGTLPSAIKVSNDLLLQQPHEVGTIIISTRKLRYREDKKLAPGLQLVNGRAELGLECQVSGSRIKALKFLH